MTTPTNAVRALNIADRSMRLSKSQILKNHHERPGGMSQPLQRMQPCVIGKRSLVVLGGGF